MSSAESGAIGLHGALTALVTPMRSDGRVDRPSLARIVRWQLEEGIDGLVPCGTTGEAATLDDDEKASVIETVVEATAGRVPVVAGCGSNSTRQTVQAARRAAAAGADALLVVSPYYNKPNRSGMIAHYTAVAEATDLPVVVYNVPGRTGQNLGAEMILRLAQVPGIVAVKEAAGDLEQVSAILEGRPDGFAVLSGDDPLVLPTIALGADGVISVVSNQAPRPMADLVAATRAGDLETARRIHFRLLPLIRCNFIESNPVPVKTAMMLLGFCDGTLRAPLGPPAGSTVDTMRRVLDEVGIVGARS